MSDVWHELALIDCAREPDPPVPAGVQCDTCGRFVGDDGYVSFDYGEYGDEAYIDGGTCGPCLRRAQREHPERFVQPLHGSGRDVLDYLAWMQHCQRVMSLCDTVSSAVAAFPAFAISASAERGRRVMADLRGG